MSTTTRQEVTVEIIRKIYTLWVGGFGPSKISDILGVSAALTGNYINAFKSTIDGEPINQRRVSAPTFIEVCKALALPTPSFVRLGVDALKKEDTEEAKTETPITETDSLVATVKDLTAEVVSLRDEVRKLQDICNPARQNIALTRSTVKEVLEVMMKMLAVWSPDEERLTRMQIMNRQPTLLNKEV